MKETNEEKYVPWSVFIWVIAIATTIMGCLFYITISLMSSLSDIRSNVSSIKTDVSWIKSAIDNKKNISLN